MDTDAVLVAVGAGLLFIVVPIMMITHLVDRIRPGPGDPVRGGGRGGWGGGGGGWSGGGGFGGFGGGFSGGFGGFGGGGGFAGGGAGGHF